MLLTGLIFISGYIIMLSKARLKNHHECKSNSNTFPEYSVTEICVKKMSQV